MGTTEWGFDVEAGAEFRSGGSARPDGITGAGYLDRSLAREQVRSTAWQKSLAG